MEPIRPVRTHWNGLTAYVLICLASIVMQTSGVAWAFDRKVDVTPFIGLRGGGAFENAAKTETLRIDGSAAYGMTIDVDYEQNTQIELLWSRQQTEIGDPNTTLPFLELDIDYYHLGGTYSWSEDKRYRPYVAATAGITRFSPETSGYKDELRFSLGIGIGIKYFFTDHIGFLIEGRGIGTFMGGSGSVFCDGGCTINIEQELLMQYEGRTGIIFRF